MPGSYNAGVNTKLDVLEAETQLADDRKLLADGLAAQKRTRRNLAAFLSLPQDVTPTAATPARPLGLWEASLQESILAAYNYREELDQLILDISINNSDANASLAAVQPVLSFVNTTSTFRMKGRPANGAGATLRWMITAGVWTMPHRCRPPGVCLMVVAPVPTRRLKQAAEESTQRFAASRNNIRLEVEESFIIQRTNQNIKPHPAVC